MTATSYSLTPDSASIQPEPQDFEAVEREFGPLPLDASEQEAAHRYRLVRATKILRISTRIGGMGCYVDDLYGVLC